MIPSYLIHSKVTSERRQRAENALKKYTSDITVIECFDAVDLRNYFIEGFSYDTELIWNEQLALIKPILIDNYNSINEKKHISNGIEFVRLFKQYDDNIHQQNYDWLQYRGLNCGEISVNMKHFFALSSIAMGNYDYGLIAEDDIIENNSFEFELFQNLFPMIKSHAIDYLDLAGGCSLHPCPSCDQIDEISNLAHLGVNRTRTNAAYLVSKSLAKFFVSNFFPLATPIDWHLMSILQRLSELKTYWTLSPIFIHGSETDVYSSWRT